MTTDVCKIVAPGMRASVQDLGRPGWARFGVPPSGAMDDHAASWANRLLDNLSTAPVLEFLGQGARLQFLNDTWIALTGAAGSSDASSWRVVQVRAHDTVELSERRPGLWTYLAVPGGFDAPQWLGSASVCARAHLGQLLQRGDILHRMQDSKFTIPPGVSSRVVPWTEQRHYSNPPPLRVYPAPQWDLFSPVERNQFFSQEWTVSPQSDRTGYRLSGTAMQHNIAELLSEPVLVGTIQVPANGQPIVTMRDGPTVGGYPKLAVLDPANISWLAQVQPGQRVRFQLADAI